MSKSEGMTLAEMYDEVRDERDTLRAKVAELTEELGLLQIAHDHKERLLDSCEQALAERDIKVAELEARQQWVAVEDGLPKDERLAEVYYCDEGIDVFSHDWFEDGVWQSHYSSYEHFEAVGGAAAIPGEASAGPSEAAPYTHWRYVTPPTEDKPERNTCYYLEGDLCTKQAPCDCYPPDTTEDKPGQVLPEWQGAGEYLEGKGDE